MSADKQLRAAAMRRSLPLLAAAFLTGYLAFFAPGSARAAAFTVNSTIDAVDANPRGRRLRQRLRRVHAARGRPGDQRDAGPQYHPHARWHLPPKHLRWFR